MVDVLRLPFEQVVAPFLGQASIRGWLPRFGFGNVTLAYFSIKAGGIFAPTKLLRKFPGHSNFT